MPIICIRAVLNTGGNMAVTLYRQIGKGKARRYQKVNRRNSAVLSAHSTGEHNKREESRYEISETD
jgi:hypothetical protein